MTPQATFLTPGRLKQFDVLPSCFQFLFENAQLQVSFLKNKACKIHFTQDAAEFDWASYAVIDDNPENTAALTWKDKTDRIQLISQNGMLEISKSDGLLRFLNSQGEVLCEDEPGLGHAWHTHGLAVYKKLEENDRFTGLGGKSGPINKRGRYYQMVNTDHFGYHENSDPLYASIPFFTGFRGNNAYGIFFDNNAYSHFDFGASQERYYSFGANEGPLRYYLFSGNPVSIIEQYTCLTGRAAMPPKWALGYQQCRYSYYPDTAVQSLIEQFEWRQFPIDVVYLDIHYMDQYKVFTWSREYFPDPERLIKLCQSKNIQLTVILDPGIKKEAGYVPYDEGNKLDIWISYPDGRAVEGKVWPGNCVFPDFTHPACRAWWSRHVSEWVSMGIKGLWNDMNEPAVWGNRFPEIAQMHGDGRPQSFAALRNVYGMQMAKSTLEGAQHTDPEDRYFVLTRASYAGGQRYSAIWTGDNSSNEKHMRLSTRMVSGLNMAGYLLAGSDIGGFIGECTPELFMRWIGLGAFQPLYRSHTMINSRPAEPWGFGEEAEQIARQYIQFRYRLIPWWYSLIYRYKMEGRPLCADLTMQYYMQDEVFDEAFGDQFLCGQTFLIAAGSIHHPFTEIYLPAGETWCDLYNGQRVAGGQKYVHREQKHFVPAFLRENQFLLSWPETIDRAEKYCQAIELHLFSLNQHEPFWWYDDDGKSNSYENGQFMLREISWDEQKKVLSISEQEGNWNSPVKEVIIYLHGVDEKVILFYEGKEVPMQPSQFSFFQPLTAFDPYEQPETEGQTIFGSIMANIRLDSKKIELIFQTV
jgi:alpha-glucosidase